jgi:hypothetical protein
MMDIVEEMTYELASVAISDVLGSSRVAEGVDGEGACTVLLEDSLQGPLRRGCPDLQARIAATDRRTILAVLCWLFFLLFCVQKRKCMKMAKRQVLMTVVLKKKRFKRRQVFDSERMKVNEKESGAGP